MLVERRHAEQEGQCESVERLLHRHPALGEQQFALLPHRLEYQAGRRQDRQIIREHIEAQIVIWSETACTE